MLCIETTFKINTQIHSKSKPLQASIALKHDILITKRGLLKGDNKSSLYWRDDQIPITGMGQLIPITKLRKKQH